jgi:regulator of protease activity HflC (stomatin/prohibitin superfamily)
MDNETKNLITSAIRVGWLLGIIVCLSMWGCPHYRVFSAQKDGESKLAEAQSSREVAVAEAKAKMESAALLAQADTIRAHGVARSNQIIGKSLQGNEAYLHWLWIDGLEKNQNAVIYVPTEANLPILEAGQRARMTKQALDSLK